MPLRPYQQEAVDAAITWMGRCVDPFLMDLATGSGKSLVVAAIAEWITGKSGKRVLCLAPSKELVEQNHEKYLATGNPASIYSAGVGQKSLTHSVVFGTPRSVLNSLHKFGDFAAVIVDEAHGITPTIQAIISDLRNKNPRIRVIGLTATPYRTGTGYIYAYGPDGSAVQEWETRDPYFNTCVYRIGAHELIDMGYLTRPHADPDHAASYDTSGLELKKNGKFDDAAIEQAFEGHGRKTAEIVADIVEYSRGRQGVMVFAATIQHAEEVCASLPRGMYALVTGGTEKNERQRIIEAFKRKEIKYLVNVSVLTTGFDAPHVDVIAILRATESPGLLQQIIGRGLRLSPAKSDCLVLDYAENIERHALNDNLFEPQIQVKGSNNEGGGTINAECPACGFTNEFTARQNDDDLGINDNGYFTTLDGQVLDNGDGPMPAHYGRRCLGQSVIPGLGINERCDYRWTFKACYECDHENDIAARYCSSCKAEIIDPNEKLQIEFQKIKADPYSASTDRVLSWDVKEWHSQAGNRTLRVDYVTEYASFSIWYNPETNFNKMKEAWADLNRAVFNGRVAPSIDDFLEHMSKGAMPVTVTAVKDRTSKFYRVLGHNRPADVPPPDVEDQPQELELAE